MANIIIGAAVFGTLGAIVIKMVRDKRRGSHACRDGCAGCPYACDCKQD